MSGSAFWDSEVVQRTHSSWMESLPVRHYINEQISGDQGVWRLEWFQRVFNGRTFDRALSIGCGTGELERSLMKLGLCRRIDAFDASASIGSFSRASEDSQRFRSGVAAHVSKADAVAAAAVMRPVVSGR